MKDVTEANSGKEIRENVALEKTTPPSRAKYYEVCKNELGQILPGTSIILPPAQPCRTRRSKGVSSFVQKESHRVPIERGNRGSHDKYLGELICIGAMVIGPI